MKIWNENEKDAFSYFQWFSKDEALKRVGIIPKLSVFSINASGMFESDDKINFINFCSSEVKMLFSNNGLANNYRLFLFANVEVKDKNSRIEKHKKVWKVLQSKWQLEDFNMGVEVEMDVEGKTFFSSVAEFKLEKLSTAIQIVSSNPKRYALIASRKDNIMTANEITNIFGAAFNKYSKYMDEIDYFGLSIHFCREGDVVFRWGDSSEEAELALIQSLK